MELDLFRAPPFGQGMMNVRTVIKRRQVTYQPQPSNGSPAHIFNESIIYLGFGRDHHGSTRELTIAESQEQTSAAVDLCFPVDA